MYHLKTKEPECRETKMRLHSKGYTVRHERAYKAYTRRFKTSRNKGQKGLPMCLPRGHWFYSKLCGS